MISHPMNSLPLRQPLPESDDGLVGFRRHNDEVERDIQLRDKQLILKDLEIKKAQRQERKDRWDYWRKYGFLGGEAFWVLLAGIAIGLLLGIGGTFFILHLLAIRG